MRAPPATALLRGTPRSRTATLPNGLRITAAHLPRAHRVAVACLVRVGPRYETARSNGISHLLEHMLHRGIPGHPTAHAQALAFETLGCSLGAATGWDVGSLTLACPRESFEKGVSLLSRLFTRPRLRGLSTEKGIIGEEILEDLDEHGRLVDPDDLLRQAAFDGHPLGMPITGSLRQLGRLGLPALRRHHARHYVGAGTTIAVAGPVPPDHALEVVRRAFHRVPKGQRLPVAPPPPFAGPVLRIVASASSQTAIRLGFRGAGVHDALEPAVEVLLRVLDDGNSTRLYTRLCDERGLTYDVSAGYESADDAGLLHIGCEVTHPAVTTVLAEILSLLREVRDRGPTAAELAKAKARHRWSLAELLDDPDGVADFFADAELRGTALTLEERRSQIDEVTRAGVRSAAERLLRPENLAVVAVGLLSKRAQAEVARLVRSFG